MQAIPRWPGAAREAAGATDVEGAAFGAGPAITLRHRRADLPQICRNLRLWGWFCSGRRFIPLPADRQGSGRPAGLPAAYAFEGASHVDAF
jgi:hypothetical protein